VFFVVIGFLSVLLAAIGGWWLARVALRPIDRLTRDAHAIGTSRDFGRRVAAPRAETPRDEVERLATTFNEMLAELQEAYQEQEQTLASQRRFVADAPTSCGRRSRPSAPTSSCSSGPATSSTPRSRRGAGRFAGRDRAASRLVGDCSPLARVDSGLRLERRDEIAVDRLVRDMYRQARLLALPHEHTVVAEPVEEAVVLGEADYLKELLLILVDNAVSYTPDGGHIRLSVQEVGDEVYIAGRRQRRRDRRRGRAALVRAILPEPIPPGSAPPAATGAPASACSIAHWIADELGGRIEVDSSPGRGFDLHHRPAAGAGTSEGATAAAAAPLIRPVAGSCQRAPITS
jgi:signal transduction histidine kinase